MVPQVTIVHTSDVGTGDSSGGGGIVEILVDDDAADSSEIDFNEDQSVGDGEITSSELGNHAEDDTGSDTTSISGNEPTAPMTEISTADTAYNGTITTDSQNVISGGLFSDTELEQLQNLNISASIGGDRKN